MYLKSYNRGVVVVMVIKVVDENGEPLVVYHGTPTQDSFDAFNKDKNNINESKNIVF